MRKPIRMARAPSATRLRFNRESLALGASEPVDVFAFVQPLPCVQRDLARTTEMSSHRHTTRLSAIVLLAIVLNASAASAQPSLTDELLRMTSTITSTTSSR